MTMYDDTEANGMNERGALLDFPGADELATAGTSTRCPSGRWPGCWRRSRRP